MHSNVLMLFKRTRISERREEQKNIWE